MNLQLHHGGDIYSLLSEGIRQEEILDFSASINPLGPPASVIEALRDSLKMLRHYPDPHARQLKKAIAEQYNIEPETVIPGNGSTELIYLIVRALRPEKALIPVPTFSEYERACKCYGSSVMSYELREENNFDLNPDDFISFITSYSSEPFDMIFLCNPNNPTGRLIKKEEVLKIAEACGKARVYLVVDEAFIDFIPEESVMEHVRENPYLIVLRSMTKFYGLAGLRLGYGVFHKDIIDKVLTHKEPWTVNSPAQIAGTTAIQDKDFRTTSLNRFAQWKKNMEELFTKKGIYTLPSAANFYLFKASSNLASILRKKAILIRDCSDFRGLKTSDGHGWFRVSVRMPEENERLFREIEDEL